MRLTLARRPTAWIVIGAVLAGADLCGAQSQSTIIPAGKLELARLVDLAAERLELNIEYNDSDFKGDVTLRLDAGVSDDELWHLVNRVLFTRGFTTIYSAGDAVYSIVPLSESPKLVQVNAEPADPPAGYQALLVPLEHQPAADLTEPLSKVLEGSAGTVTVVNDSLLLVTGLTHRLDTVVDMIKLLDVPSRITVVEEIHLKNLSGAQMATLMGQIKAKRELTGGQEARGEILPALDAASVYIVAPESDLAGFRALVERLDQREQMETITYSPAHYPADDVASLINETLPFAADERWRLVIDDLTGSLVISATPAAHESIRTIVERLDATPSTARRPVRSFVIKNRPVFVVQGILENLIAVGVLDSVADRADPTPRDPDVFPMPPPLETNDAQPQPEPRAPRPRSVDDSQSPLVLTADEGTNTLIAIGEPRLLAQVATLLESIDVRQPQVMLEVLLVTLTESQSLDLGVELEKLTSYDDAQIRLSSRFGLAVSPTDGTSTLPEAGLGFTGVVLSPGDFSILVRALETITDGRSLSMPKLLVGNNQQATLDSVLQQPFASVNASNTVSTTSFGGTQDAGTVVTITPQIAEGDHLLLEYSLSLSSFQGAPATEGLPPPRQQNSVSSAATIPDGFTVVVGGIELQDQSKGVSQVPWLGSIPVIGEAFKSRKKTSSRSRFYVFIRANILRDRGFEDLKYISHQDTVAADIDDGWPRVEPRIIE